MQRGRAAGPLAKERLVLPAYTLRSAEVLSIWVVAGRYCDQRKFFQFGLLRGGIAGSGLVHDFINEGAGRHDAGAPELAQNQEVFVSGDNEIGVCTKSSSEDVIIVRVAACRRNVGQVRGQACKRSHFMTPGIDRLFVMAICVCQFWIKERAAHFFVENGRQMEGCSALGVQGRSHHRGGCVERGRH